MIRSASREVPTPEAMHPDTIAALRLLGLALTAHPEDIKTLAIYGDLPGHLTDVIDDYIDGEDPEEEEEED